MQALVSGTLAAAAVTLVASIASRRATGSYASALNATSHFLWGDRAARKHAYSMKYTGVGFARQLRRVGVAGRCATRRWAAAGAAVACARYATARSCPPSPM